ncbi:Uncharacterised protein [Mycobacteroides abscessus]|nr:Uncharacterised protein [Mycobacteroides abscessus]
MSMPRGLDISRSWATTSCHSRMRRKLRYSALHRRRKADDESSCCCSRTYSQTLR